MAKTETQADRPSRQVMARILAEALPFMQRYWGETVVIKYGGNAMVDAELARKFAADVVQLKLAGINPIVVHGGGPQIGAMLKRLGIESRFENGLRVTDRQTVDVVEMVLSGAINKAVVSEIQRAGGSAVGISGKDGNLCIARKLDGDDANGAGADLGYVGVPDKINKEIVDTILASHAIPVIAPIGVSRDGDTYNINADTFASAIAIAVAARRLLLLTDVPGVLDGNGELIAELELGDIDDLIAAGAIKGGMIPKITGAGDVVRNGVDGVIILDGRVPHCVLLELFTAHGVGTRIARKR